MISRLFKYPKNNSFFLFGPRGVGKSFFIRERFKEALSINLLEDEFYQKLVAQPSRLKEFIPKDFTDWVVIDEVQKIPALLNEVHRLIEEKKVKFILTGSSARKLRKAGVNLLAGRAFTQHAYPLTALELKDQFDLKKALTFGLLPKAYLEDSGEDFLKSYVATYLKEEVQQEGIVRNIGMFARFLEAASFSQGQVINVSSVSSECSIERKTVSNYFQILEDLLLSYSLNVFKRRAKRKLIQHRKFYLFDCGVFRQIRPRGPMDSDSELNGAALETLVLQEVIARNEYQQLGYDISFWHTQNHFEVDFVFYGTRGFYGVEVKSSSRYREKDFEGLLEFQKDYPEAKLLYLYLGTEKKIYKNIQILPVAEFLTNMDSWV